MSRKNELYKEVAVSTADYVIREMTSSEGGFYSAQDADSEGVEGKNIANLLKNENFLGEFEAEKKKLYEYRKTRYHLHLDDKILTS